MNNTALSWCINLHSAPSPSLQKPTPSPPLLKIITQFLVIDSTGHFEAERESRMGWRRVELHCGSVWGPCCEGNWVPQNGPVADPGEARVRPLFLDQTEVRRAEKKLGRSPPSPPPPSFTAWPGGELGGERVALAIRRSRVRVPLWRLGGFVLGRPEFRSSATLINSQLVF